MGYYTRYRPPKSPSVSFAPGTSRTRQEFLNESDVNRLVERFRDTGSFYDPLTTVNASKLKPMFGDYTNVPDYQAALNIVIDAEQRFAALPSRIRERFNNDPAQLLTFLGDDKHRAEAIELGLLPKPKPVMPESPVQPEPQPEPPKAAQ